VNPNYPSQAETFRETVRAFLAQNLPPGWRGVGALDGEAVQVFTCRWREVLYDNKLLAPSWPIEYGGAGLTLLERVVLSEEFNRAGVPTGGPNDRFGIQLLGNTLIEWGTDEQKQKFLPRILSGEDRWCQGYSEPEAGSDLGNLGCRAELDGDEWVLNGQKVWTSVAHLANWIFVLTRTNPYAAKHRGITFLLVPMDQPGVSVRPIRMMTGGAEFNETFFTNARTPVSNVVGSVDAGWAVAMALLGHERGEAAATFPLMFRAELDRLIRLARERARTTDPQVRQWLAWCYTKVELMRYLGMRSLTRYLAGEAPGPETSLIKCLWSEYHQKATELAVDLLGADGMVPSGRPASGSFPVDDPGAPNDSASWVGSFMVARAGTIYAGTSEIQRNIAAEMILGLPKEPTRPQGSWRESQRTANRPLS
jgi:alkylation response protein AidB-like acyl-CoA dehydrogenase